MNMAPVLDVNSNPANPVIGDRAFGATPAIVRDMGQATVSGLQENRVVACGKHFPGHGDTAADSHKELPVVAAPIERLREVEWPPFEHAVQHGVASIMTAHVRYDALDHASPATLSPAIIQSLLREQFRYDGVVLTDDLEMHAIIDHYGVGDASVRAIHAGCDVLLICKEYEREVAAFHAVEAAVKDGKISPARLQVSLARIEKLKARFVRPYKPVTISDARLTVGCRTHQALLDSLLRARDRLARVSFPAA
jgi:beta-N-acetylhexosaminidase